MSWCSFKSISWLFRSAVSSVTASPGPPARYVTASFATGLNNAGNTTTRRPIVRPFGFKRFSGTTKVPQRAGTLCTVHGLSVSGPVVGELRLREDDPQEESPTAIRVTTATIIAIRNTIQSFHSGGARVSVETRR